MLLWQLLLNVVVVNVMIFVCHFPVSKSLTGEQPVLTEWAVAARKIKSPRFNGCYYYCTNLHSH
jgi:hypothetical protein